MDKMSDKDFLDKLAQKMKAGIEFETADSLHVNDFHLYSSVSKERLDV